MTTTYYIKRGGRYHPVRQWDPQLDQAMPPGHHLVSVQPGQESRRYNIEPARAPMIAAGLLAEEAMSRAIANAMELKSSPIPLTPRQQELMSELTASMNRQDLRWMCASASEAAQAGVRALQEEAERLLTNVAVRRAYEDFLIVCELTKKEQDHNI
jgi:hypothetical protein